jgi:hypothetical protein
MKVKIGNYPTRLVCNIHSDYMEKKYGFLWSESTNTFEKFLEKLDVFVQGIYNIFNRLYFDKKEQKIVVKLDKWDSWSAYVTLAHVIHPVLLQLQEEKQGSPEVDLSDVPESLHPPEDFDRRDIHKSDINLHNRWDYVISEMIWAFDQVRNDEDFIDNEVSRNRMYNGLRLFGKYYLHLWD